MTDTGERDDLTITETEDRVIVSTRRGPFPIERFAIACVIIPGVWILSVSGFVGAVDELLPQWLGNLLVNQRILGSLIVLALYLLATFHGFFVPGDQFSAFLSSAFLTFDIEVNSQAMEFRKHWLLRKSVKRIPIEHVEGFEIRDGWFVCRTTAGEVVICDGPPTHVIREPMRALNEAIERFRG